MLSKVLLLTKKVSGRLKINMFEFDDMPMPILARAKLKTSKRTEQTLGNISLTQRNSFLDEKKSGELHSPFYLKSSGPN